MAMPVMACELEGKPGYKYGPNGKCYTYTPGDERSRARARLKAELQGYAIRRAQERRGVREELEE
jgi:hypothetical protein